MEDFGFVFNRMITERNPPGHQELETLSASSSTQNQLTDPPSQTRNPVANNVESVLAESTVCGENATDCDEGASGASTNTWTRNGVVFTIGIYSVLTAINL
jgi:hypothetical protein